MKFKEIKPGMVIHCPKEEDAKTLLRYLDSLGYRRRNGDRLTSASLGQHWKYDEETVYLIEGETVLQDRMILHPDITEFSDLIEPEPRFKVGDKVRTRENLMIGEKYGGMELLRSMKKYLGGYYTISDVSPAGYYYIGATDFFWSEEMLEPVNDFNAPNASSNALNDKSNAQMSAVEVLEWLAHFVSYDDYSGVFERLHDEYGDEYGFTDLVNEYTPQEIVAKITAYEAAKKAPEESQNETNKIMTACEKIEWLNKHSNPDLLMEIFGNRYVDIILDKFTTAEFIERIDKYEAKKAQKPVEVESGYHCSIMGKMGGMKEYDILGVTEETARNDLIEKATNYTAGTGDPATTNIYFFCRVKEDK